MANQTPAPLLERLRVLAREAARSQSPLPAEPALAGFLEVSRSQLREALARLEYEGLVIRRPRSGTVVNRAALGIQTWIGWQEPFIETLRRLGHHDARVELLALDLRPLGPTEAASFDQAPGCAALQVRKRWRAGGRVQMLSDYVVPAPGATTITDVDGAGDPVFDVARRVSGSSPAWEVAHVRAEALAPDEAESLELAAGVAVLVLDLLGVNAGGQKLYRIVERHAGDAVEFGFVRTFRTGRLRTGI